MTRHLLFLSALSFLILGTSGRVALAQDESIWSKPLRIRESDPVMFNDAKFVAVTQAEWIPNKEGDGTWPMPIETQLRITNLKKSDVIFPIIANFGLSIKKEDGAKVALAAGGNHPAAVRPILLTGGASYTLTLGSELRWDPKSKESTLAYRHGGNYWYSYGPLKNGKYKLRFWYSTTRFRSGSRNYITPVWEGDTQTAEVEFEVKNP